MKDIITYFGPSLLNGSTFLSFCLFPNCTGKDSKLDFNVLMAEFISSIYSDSISFRTNFGINFRFCFKIIFILIFFFLFCNKGFKMHFEGCNFPIRIIMYLPFPFHLSFLDVHLAPFVSLRFARQHFPTKFTKY